jgi:alkylation response protein AidB-like acyl-CoA dehydrogenase
MERNMAVAQHSIDEYLKAARGLTERVAAATDRIDSGREIPSDLAGELADKGFFRLLMPRSLGGAELDFLDFLQIVQMFAEVDGSVAWCINQNNIFATNSVRMPEQTAREIWSGRRDVVTNGPPISSARAVPVDGGYRLSGRWNFSSGIRHATWVAALTPVSRSDGDANSATEGGNLRTLLIPKKDVSLVDVWQVGGLRGTGSFSFEVDDLFVPSSRTYAPSDGPREDGVLYVIPTGLMFACGFATVALGVARASLDSAIDLAGRKIPFVGRRTQRDEPTTQRQIGQAEAIWGSARAFLRESTSSAWEGALKNQSLTVEERVRMRLAGTHAIRMSAEVVDIAYSVCGSNSIFASNPVQRRFQDIHVITQQFQGRMDHYDTAGKFFLGLEPEGMS